ncbi:MAG: phytanoyl-CoA dioxygenase family protein [Lentisphaeria bacterium]|nr:phytanoyl-CoA dioxygenase family protein [Lentisphaeria bacterium]NQZ68765.1 phytanoyl-CoA dioxygenase family protein [Lentisphaeria bacterium]
MAFTDDELKQYNDDGWVVKENIFTDSDMLPIKKAITDIISTATKDLMAEGKLDKDFADESFETRLAKICSYNPEAGDTVYAKIMGGGGGGFHGQEILDTFRHQALLDCIEQLVGKEIIASSVYRIRPKRPSHGHGEVPWHQDAGYIMPHCGKYLIVTCWIPLVDVNIENGCLYVVPGKHDLLKHYSEGHAGFLEIPKDMLPEKPIHLDMKAGSVLFMTSMTPHASFENKTDRVRWSLDLRFQNPDVPNNIGESPADYAPGRDPVTMACFPPEADFVIQSPSNPESEVRDAATFAKFRENFENGHVHAPGHGWSKLAERSEQ